MPDWEAIARQQLAEDIREFYEDPLGRSVADLENALEEGGDAEEQYARFVQRLDEFAGYAHHNVTRAGYDVDEPQATRERMDRRGRE